MKRTGNLFPRITDRENLRLAFWRASRGKKHHDDVRQFERSLEHRLSAISTRLEDHTFPFGNYSQFEIFDPKRRMITAPCFEERVVHHAIMNVCEPAFERCLIDDTYACRVGRGRIKCLNRALEFTARYRYALKLDIRTYFDSVNHEILVGQLSRLLKDREVMRLLQRVVANYELVTGIGLPIGALTSQHFANHYLTPCDRYIKETLRYRGYIRYMDDFVLWSNDRRGMIASVEQVRTFLSRSLNLDLKPIRLFRSATGVEMLGCRVFRSHVTLNRRSKRRYRKKLQQLVASLATGTVEEIEFQRRATSLRAFTDSGNTKSWKWCSNVLRLAHGGWS